MTAPTPSRRNVVRGVGWASASAVIVAAGQAPVYAASADPITGLVEALKCPGNSTPGVRDAVVVAFRTRTQEDANALLRLDLSAWAITGNGQVWDIKRVSLIGSTIYVVTVPRGNSANASGTLELDYTIGGRAYHSEFAYSGTSPDHDICRNV